MTKTTPIRVLIADDSALMRILITDIIEEDPIVDVVGQANNGQTAFLMTQQLRPDVVLMDLNMGDYDGQYGVAQIMQYCPTPVVILSSLGNVDMNPILETLRLGAIDYLNKPAKNRMDLKEVQQQLLEKIKMASQVEVNVVKEAPRFINYHKHSFDKESLPYDCVVIGASTGGPHALEAVLTQLPQNFAVPIYIVQHIPANFASSFAERLNGLTPLEVQLATYGTTPEVGAVYLASGVGNLCIKRKGKRVVFEQTYDRSLYYNHPSIDVMMTSVAGVYGKRAIGVLLTGMGRDGASGLKAIRNAGGYTIAQSEETCVVYGMPKIAVEQDAVEQVVHLPQIAGFLVSCLA